MEVNREDKRREGKKLEEGRECWNKSETRGISSSKVLLFRSDVNKRTSCFLINVSEETNRCEKSVVVFYESCSAAKTWKIMEEQVKIRACRLMSVMLNNVSNRRVEMMRFVGKSPSARD